jgi:colanic acid/amylovoran biosynthesis protein
MNKIIKHITIVNAHWSNRGDEAALLSIVNGLQKNYIDCEIVILFKDDISIQQFPNIKNVNYDLAKFNAKIWDIWLTTITRGMIGINKKLKFMVKTLLKSDIIIYSPGGSVINSRFFWRKQMEYLVPFICAKFYNIPLLIAAPSIGPFDLSQPNTILKWLLKVPKVFVVREEISKRYLKEIGITKNIVSTIDSAFYDDIKEEENEKKLEEYLELKEYLNSYKKVVGLTITDFAWHVKYGKDKELSTRIKDSFSKFLDKLQNEGYGVIFIPQLFGNQNDSDYMNNFSTEKTFMLKDTYDTYFQQYIISKLYAVEGMRYHSNIFSAKVGTPFIPVVYEEKMEGFIDISGLNSYAISLNELSFENLEEKFEKLNDNYDEVKNSLKNMFPMYKNEAIKTVELLGRYK